MKSHAETLADDRPIEVNQVWSINDGQRRLRILAMHPDGEDMIVQELPGKLGRGSYLFITLFPIYNLRRLAEIEGMYSTS